MIQFKGLKQGLWDENSVSKKLVQGQQSLALALQPKEKPGEVAYHQIPAHQSKDSQTTQQDRQAMSQ